MLLVNQEAGDVAHGALANVVAANALSREHVNPELAGGSVGIWGRLARDDVVVAKAARDVAQAHRNGLAVHLVTSLVEALGKLAHPAVRAASRLFARRPNLGGARATVNRHGVGVKVGQLLRLVEHVVHVHGLLDGSRRVGVYALVQALDGASRVLGVDHAVALAEVPEEPQASQSHSKHQGQGKDKHQPARRPALLASHLVGSFHSGALSVSARLFNQHTHLRKHAL